MKKVAKSLVIGLITVGLLAAAGCGGRNSGESSKNGQGNEQGVKEVKIGVVGALTGPSAVLGEYLTGGVKGALKKIEEEKLYPDYKFVPVYRDDEANPTKSAAAIEELIYKEGVVAVIGPTNTTTALADLVTAFKAEVPLIDPIATGTMIAEKAKKLSAGGKNYFFRTTTPDEIQAQRMVKYVKDKGYKKPAVLHDTTAYGKGGAKELHKALKGAGLEAVISVGFNTGSPDLTPEVLQAKNAGADVLLVWALGHDHAQVTKAKNKLGWNVLQLGSTAIQMTNYRKLVGDISTGNKSIWPRDHVRPEEGKQVPQKVQDAYKFYKQAVPSGMALEDFGSGLFAYDATLILAQAINSAGTEPKAVRDALESAEFKGLASKESVKFSPDSHEVWTADDLAVVEMKNMQVIQIPGE